MLLWLQCTEYKCQALLFIPNNWIPLLQTYYVILRPRPLHCLVYRYVPLCPALPLLFSHYIGIDLEAQMDELSHL